MHSFKIRVHLYDMLFYLLLVFSFYFTRNMLCRLMMVVFFGYTVIRQVRNNGKILYSFFYTGFLMFILYGATNILFKNVIDPNVARTMVVSLILNLLMIYAIVQYIYMQNDIQKVLKITELGIFTTAFVVILLSLGTITTGRLGRGTEINANTLAILCVCGLILCLYLRKDRYLSRPMHIFRIIFYLLVIILTGSRKGLVMVFLAIMIISFFNGRRKLVRNILFGISAAVIGYILIMNIPAFYNIMGVRVESLLKYLADGTATEGSLKSRLELIETGMEYIREKPWTGYGYDCFKLISGIGAQGNVSDGEFGFYSHNNYVELLFGGGIIGFVLYYIPVVYLVVKLFKRTRKDVCVPYLLAMLVSLLSVEYARVTYYARIDSYITGVLLGCAIIAGRGQCEQSVANTKEITE